MVNKNEYLHYCYENGDRIDDLVTLWFFTLLTLVVCFFFMTQHCSLYSHCPIALANTL